MINIVSTIFAAIAIIAQILSTSTPIHAAEGCSPCTSNTSLQCCSGCSDLDNCVSNHFCVEVVGLGLVRPIGGECGSALIGGVNPPNAIQRYNLRAAMDQQTTVGAIGIFYFVVAGLRLFFIIAGLLVFGNFIYAGYIYITQAGDSKAHTLVRERVTFSIVGLVVMVSAFIVASLIGAIVFGDAGFILNPSITQYGALERLQ